jgi:hypothetical protein
VGIGISGIDGQGFLQSFLRSRQTAQSTQDNGIVVVIDRFGRIQFDSPSDTLGSPFNSALLLAGHAQQMPSTGMVGTLLKNAFVNGNGGFSLARLVEAKGLVERILG